MNFTKVFTLMARNDRIRLLMCTRAQSTIAKTTADKKLEHYRNLNALQNNELKPIDWDEAKPFESIPGPKPLPVIGNAWRFFLPKIGSFYGMDFVGVHKYINEKYGDVSILNGIIFVEPMVLLFNPTDIEKLHRNESIWPQRKALEAFVYYRNMKKKILSSGGLMSLQGEDWFKFRTVVNPILMQPRNIVQYTDKMNLVADELVDNIKYFSQQNEQGQMPNDFHKELYKWSLESIGVVTMDTHLGCLKRSNDKNSEAQKLIQGILRMFDLMFNLDVLPSFWRIVSTPDWKEFVRILDFLLQTNLKYLNKYLDKIEKGEIDKNQSETLSVLQQLIKVDRTVALAMSVDMMIAGVDTTGRVLASALYYLAKNPRAQEKLREEACTLLKTKDAPVTKETLSKALYTKAVIKETTRLSPIAIGTFRTTTKDLVLGGYQVPAGTNVLTSTLKLCKVDKYFTKAKEFFPERWLSTTTGELSYKTTNPFVFAPFGYGPRSCIGKRLANLELEVALLKIIRNFELKWPHEDMVFSTVTLHGIARPLKLHVKALDS